MKLSILAAAMLVISGCASGYAKFYRPLPGATPEAIAETRAGPPPSIPLVDRTGMKPDDIVPAYGANGFAPIGFSSFNGAGGQSEQGAIDQAKKIGADLVVLSNPQYTGTKSSVIPMITPTTSTSYSSGTATIYGTHGTATAYGSGTITTYGTQTNFIPVSTERFDYGAIYFVKLRVHFGVQTRVLNNDERASLQTNKGVVVTAVTTGSPAFMADVLVGDIMIAVDGEPVIDVQQMGPLIKNRWGKTARFTFRRNGQVVEKYIHIL